MRHLIAASLVAFVPASFAWAESPTGEWLVKDGTARIRVVECSGKLWGVISWTKDTPGKDVNNPNPALRNRSIMGMPILIDMKHGSETWDGEVYNAEDGSTYTSHVGLEGPDVLRIEGCVFGGFICGGENWTRVPLPKGSPSDQEVCSRLPK